MNAPTASLALLVATSFLQGYCLAYLRNTTGAEQQVWANRMLAIAGGSLAAAALISLWARP